VDSRSPTSRHRRRRREKQRDANRVSTAKAIWIGNVDGKEAPEASSNAAVVTSETADQWQRGDALLLRHDDHARQSLRRREGDQPDRERGPAAVVSMEPAKVAVAALESSATQTVLLQAGHNNHPRHYSPNSSAAVAVVVAAAAAER